MARTVAPLPAGARSTDYISLGVITKTFPLTTVRAVLAASGKASLRERDLPAHVVMYYVIALALFMQVSYREVLRCLLEGLQWLRDPVTPLKVAGKSGISQARTRLGWEALRQLHDAVVRPIALPATRGAWHRQWRLVSLDGSTLDVADEEANAAAFGRPGSSRGGSAHPPTPLLSPGGERHACGVRQPYGGLRNGRDPARPGCADRLAAGHAVPGRPPILRLCVVAGGARARG